MGGPDSQGIARKIAVCVAMTIAFAVLCFANRASASDDRLLYTPDVPGKPIPVAIEFEIENIPAIDEVEVKSSPSTAISS